MRERGFAGSPVGPVILSVWLVTVGVACGDDDGEGADATDSGGGADATDSDGGEVDLVPYLSAERMRATVDTLAAPELGGRIPGSPGHRMARDYLTEQMTAIGLEPLGEDGYVQTYASSTGTGNYQLDEDGDVEPNENDTGHNLVGRLAGTARPDEHIVLMAHYDHLGVTEDGQIYNGAFDNAGGVAVVLEVARVLSEQDAAPERSIVFLFTDDEEFGLAGSAAWVASPTVPLESVVAAISADPMGRALLPDYNFVLAAGLERSPDLAALFRAESDHLEADLALLDRELIPPIFSSDQDNFHEAGIPAVWLFNTGLTFYHQTGDEPETIDYTVLLDTAGYLLNVLLAIGDDPARYTYAEPDAFSLDNAVEVQRVLNGVLSSSVLTSGERRQVTDLLEEADSAVETQSWQAVGGSPQTYFLRVATLVIFQLPQAHPGPIPPSFPGE
jgi:hypothetical protein